MGGFKDGIELFSDPAHLSIEEFSRVPFSLLELRETKTKGCNQIEGGIMNDGPVAASFDVYSDFIHCKNILKIARCCCLPRIQP